MRSSLPLAEHAPAAPRMRQHTNEHERRRAPRHLAQLQPVELQLLPRRMIDLDRDINTTALAALTQQTQPKRSQLPRERLIGPIEPELPQLAEQHGTQHVRVITEPRLQIRPVGLEHTRRPLRSLA
jgi:hypothetical protein